MSNFRQTVHWKWRTFSVVIERHSFVLYSSPKISTFQCSSRVDIKLEWLCIYHFREIQRVVTKSIYFYFTQLFRSSLFSLNPLTPIHAKTFYQISFDESIYISKLKWLTHLLWLKMYLSFSSDRMFHPSIQWLYLFEIYFQWAWLIPHSWCY